MSIDHGVAERMIYENSNLDSRAIRTALETDDYRLVYVMLSYWSAYYHLPPVRARRLPNLSSGASHTLCSAFAKQQGFMCIITVSEAARLLVQEQSTVPAFAAAYQRPTRRPPEYAAHSAPRTRWSIYPQQT